jgi:hypothetical protein
VLTKEQFKDAISGRLNQLYDSCNSTHITHTEGVIRGLIWGMTGKDPGALHVATSERILTLSEMPYKIVGKEIFWGTTEEKLQSELAKT